MRASIVVSVIAGSLLAACMALLSNSQSNPLLSWLTERPTVVSRTLPPGTVIRGLLQSSVGSVHSRPGDVVTLSVTEPVVLDGAISIPRGASILGRVTEVRAAGEAGGRGLLTLTYKSVTDVTGRLHRLKARPLRTSELLPAGGVAGGDIELQRGDRLEVTLEAPLTVPIGRAGGTS